MSVQSNGGDGCGTADVTLLPSVRCYREPAAGNVDELREEG